MAETIRTRTFSKDGVVYTLMDDGYRIRFTQKGGGKNIDPDEEILWAEYKQCDLPRAGEDIAELFMSSIPMTPIPTPALDRGAVALKVLSAWLSNPEVFWDATDDPSADYYARMAKHAYMAADAFLASGASAPGVTSEVPRKECVCDGFGCAMCTPSIAKKVKDIMAEKRREDGLPMVAPPPAQWCLIHQTLDWCHDSGTTSQSGQKTSGGATRQGTQRAKRKTR